jgi:hypothetical protein
MPDLIFSVDGNIYFQILRSGIRRCACSSIWRVKSFSTWSNPASRAVPLGLQATLKVVDGWARNGASVRQLRR